MIDYSVIAALFVVLLTIYIFYYLRKDKLRLRVRESAHTSKPASKDELLKARVEHFRKLADSNPKKEDNPVVNSPLDDPSLDLEKPPPIIAEDLKDSDFPERAEQRADNDTTLPNKVDSGSPAQKSGTESFDDTSQDGLKHTQSEPTEVLVPSLSSPLDNNLKQPQCKPIKTLPELLNWIAGYEDFSIGRILRRPISGRVGSKPKTLVCHDMKGGYIEDRFVQGYNSDKCFSFSHWNLIDTFCYFSHSFVTIPPPCWTNAAHSNGVKMLGTVITEWDDGASICAEIFQSITYVEKVAQILVDIALYYQFDGWLINIENRVEPNKIEFVCHFLSTLTDLMHRSIPESEVIWYDSVTKTGELRWQNKLCSENLMFFNACDGIFLNYNWSINDLQHSAAISGPTRRYDVYVGVDVFGRGCYGGGGWNTYKAMNVIREQKLSAAIFAPGWVMETLDVDKFAENDEKFWKLLRTYLYGHCISTLPFVSTFCRGYGKRQYICGQEVSTSSWTNLSASSLQPTFDNNFYQLGPYDGMEIYMKSTGFSADFSFNGGGCYIINGMVKPFSEQTKTIFRLFDTNISLKSKKNYFLSYAFHNSNSHVEVYTVLLFEDRPNYLLFMPPKDKLNTEVSTKYSIPPTQEGNYVEIYPIDKEECNSCYADFSIPTEWYIRNYRFSLERAGILKEVRFACTVGGVSDISETTDFSIKVGEIRIHNIADLSVKLPTADNLKCHNVDIRNDGEKKWLSFMLSWDIIINNGCALPKCFDIFCSGNDGQEVSNSSANEYIETKNNENYGFFIGRAFSDSYCVSNLIVPSSCTGGIKILVQSISYAEVRQNHNDSGSVILRW